MLSLYSGAGQISEVGSLQKTAIRRRPCWPPSAISEGALYTGQTEEGPGIKVSDSAFQYQVDPDPDSANWIFRYDYIREPRTHPYPYPQSHLQVNAGLQTPGLFLLKGSLAHIHFPTFAYADRGCHPSTC